MMLKKVVRLALLACLAFSISNAFAQTCEQNNYVLLSQDKICCCIPDTTSSQTNDYVCRPTTQVNGNQCPLGEKALTTPATDRCYCKFRIE